MGEIGKTFSNEKAYLFFFVSGKKKRGGVIQQIW